jgi:EAL domain-containing protein (putative c-di-GMP-specific phosphodiesterase class I)/DNA-binding NarL/FixJ family response regulator
LEKLLLLVDDEPSILKSLKRLFHRTDYTVLTANCAYQALDIIREKPIAVLISDYTMPGLSGADLLAMAKSLRPDIYAVILSGNNDQQSVIRSINEGGAAKFITKPWTDKALIATVDEAYATWLDQHYSLQVPGLLNQKTYLQHLQSNLGHPYLNDYVIVCFELQDLREIRHQLGTSELQQLFTRLFLQSGAVNAEGVHISLLDDGRISACLKLDDREVPPDSALDEFFNALPELISFRDYQLPVHFNIGYTVSSRFCHASETLLKNASIALNVSRNAPQGAYRQISGRPGTRLIPFEPGMESRLATQLSKTSCLHHALELDEFSLVYQPKINTVDQCICGAEALLRWSNPTFGMVPPDEFIPLAEQYGLINDIGDWVLQRASTQWTSTNDSWRNLSASGATLSINVSSIQLTDPHFISRFGASINASNISPSSLELEVTETALIKDMNNAIVALARIRELGVKISIDDFGTGYSSLSYLNKLPVDILKIDRSFIAALSEDSSSIDLVRNLINLGKDLGLEIVAEGVEQAPQIELLGELGCEIFQGYYFSRPLPAHQFEQFVDNFQQPTGWSFKQAS